MNGTTSPGHRLAPHTAVAMLLAGAALSACSSGQLPDGASLTISPAEQTIDITERRDVEGRCTIVETNHVDLPIVLALRDAQGSPIGDAEIDVYVDWAANTYSGYPVLALYRDMNGNGVVDGEGELVSGGEDDIARVETSEYGGASNLLLRVNLSCSYRGRVFAFTENAFASATVAVNALDVIEPSASAPRPGETS